MKQLGIVLSGLLILFPMAAAAQTAQPIDIRSATPIRDSISRVARENAWALEQAVAIPQESAQAARTRERWWTRKWAIGLGSAIAGAAITCAITCRNKTVEQTVINNFP
jgi:hypothetical protein